MVVMEKKLKLGDERGWLLFGSGALQYKTAIFPVMFHFTLHWPINIMYGNELLIGTANDILGTVDCGQYFGGKPMAGPIITM